MTRLRIALAAAALAAVGGAAAQEAVPCPDSVPNQVACYGGTDSAGAPYLIVVPREWNKVLIVHARDGPDLKPPSLERVADDLGRWTAFVKAGYAWAGTGRRRAGYEIASAVEDLESVRVLFAERLGTPRRTVIHGQGWGAGVAARAIELHPKSYDGALLTSGELAGARGADPRIDLRVVYQFYCRNLPRPSEPAYPLWMGSPRGSALTSADVRVRFDECTGANLPADRRSAAQRRALAALGAVTRIPERTLAAELAWATLVVADLVNRRLGGRDPFTTEGVRYRGDPDDRALNEGVARFHADSAAAAQLAAEADPTGRVGVPVVTLHGVGDPTAFVEHESAYRETVERAGNGERLLQVFTGQAEHRSLGSAEYLAALAALMAWIDGAKRPDAADVAARCRGFLPRFDGESCHILPGYRPPPWESRVYIRVH